MSNQAKLPDHPGDLIRLAIGDLAKVEADPRYRVNMNEWHAPGHNGLCSVCFAGAVMAGSLGASREVESSPHMFGSNSDKLKALDRFREGDVQTGLCFMGLEPLVQGMDVTPYGQRRSAFRRDMLAMADALDEAFPKEGAE